MYKYKVYKMYIQDVQQHMSSLGAFAVRPRLVTTAEFIEVNGASPITQIAGFSPWRTFL